MIKWGGIARKRYSSEQIIGYLREAEILQAKGILIGYRIISILKIFILITLRSRPKRMSI